MKWHATYQMEWTRSSPPVQQSLQPYVYKPLFSSMNDAQLGKGSIAAPHNASCLARSITSRNLKGYDRSFIAEPVNSPGGVNTCSAPSGLRAWSENGVDWSSCDASHFNVAEDLWWTAHNCCGSGAWGKWLQRWCSSTMSTCEYASSASSTGSEKKRVSYILLGGHHLPIGIEGASWPWHSTGQGE